MPIPKSRADLIDSMETTYAKLAAELARGEDRLGPHAFGNLLAVDDWSVKDLLAVRLWWTQSVIDWVDAGRRGEKPVTPAEGYGWHETPRLNADIVAAAERETYIQIREALDVAYLRARTIVDELDDRELLEPHAFEWSGRYPVARLISINTTRQYTTARTYVRRALGGAMGAFAAR